MRLPQYSKIRLRFLCFLFLQIAGTTIKVCAQDSLFPKPYSHSFLLERQFIPSFNSDHRDVFKYNYQSNCFRFTYHYLLSFAEYNHQLTGVTANIGLLYREGEFEKYTGGGRTIKGHFNISRWYIGTCMFTEFKKLAGLRIGAGFEGGSLLSVTGKVDERIYTNTTVYTANGPVNTGSLSYNKGISVERVLFNDFYLDLYADIGFRIKLRRKLSLLVGSKGFIERRDMAESPLIVSGSFYAGFTF